MNKVELLGRLTKDPELKATPNGVSVCRFTLAVTRRLNREESDFISCIAWRGTADFIAKYFKKGSPIVLVGELQTGSYEKDGQKIYTTDVVVSEAEFVPASKAEGTQRNTQSKPAVKKEEEPADDWDNTVLDMLNEDNDLPF